MSYFTNKNTSEVGPGPTNEIEWLIVENLNDINGVTRCAVVRARTAYFAMNKAESIINDMQRQKCTCYPSPVLKFEGV